MPLRLSLDGGRAARSLVAGTLSIGRGEGNDWVLPDPERHLSKTHCVISIEGGRWILTDLSTNGVYINGARQPTSRDSRVVLTDGDEFRLGDHRFLVEEAAASSTGPARMDDGAGPLDIDPLDDPLGAPVPHNRAPAFSHPVRQVAPAQRNEDPFDRADDARHRQTTADDDLFQGAKPAVEWAGPTQPDNADAPRHAMPVSRVTAPLNMGEIDFDALIGDLSDFASAKAPPTPPALARPASANPFDAFEPTRPSPPDPPPTPTSAPPPPTDAARAAMTAFLEGAGAGHIPVSSDPEAAMRAWGQVFRAMTEGLRDVLMSRATVKSELRVEQTMIKAANNNPLKFSLTAEDAVTALLSTGRPGYMPPLAAAREALDDIKTHELAVMAGVQTALVGLLRRFDPDALEARLVQGKLAAMLPAARKARLWDSFRETYKTIASEAEDDFQAVFGRAFAKAYMAQLRKNPDMDEPQPIRTRASSDQSGSPVG